MRSISLLINIYILFVIIITIPVCTSNDIDDVGSIHEPVEQPVYHTPESLEKYLQQMNQIYPEITYLEPVGFSIEGRTIWAFIISDNPSQIENEPKIRLTGSIHGDENASTEILALLIEHIIVDYFNGNERVQNIVDNRYIVFVPMLNPDGVVADSRENINNVDLNRNFDVEWKSSVGHGSSPFSELESQAFRDYSSEMVFHSSLTFHTGAVIVNMPFDYDSQYYGGDIPGENDLVNYLAAIYSTSGRFLESPGLLDHTLSTDGTINGGDWYIAYGTLQDWSYVKTGCIDLTIEITNFRPDETSEITEIFDYNKESILSYIDATGTGVLGRAYSSNSEPIVTSITIDGGDIITYSDDFGYYHRILLPGNYIITFTANEYDEYSQEIQIIENISTELDVYLTKK